MCWCKSPRTDRWRISSLMLLQHVEQAIAGIPHEPCVCDLNPCTTAEGREQVSQAPADYHSVERYLRSLSGTLCDVVLLL